MATAHNRSPLLIGIYSGVHAQYINKLSRKLLKNEKSKLFKITKTEADHKDFKRILKFEMTV